MNGSMGNRTRDFPACSVVPQPATLPRLFTYTDQLTIYRVFRDFTAELQEVIS
jgi:hypothetical protein